MPSGVPLLSCARASLRSSCNLVQDVRNTRSIIGRSAAGWFEPPSVPREVFGASADASDAPIPDISADGRSTGSGDALVVDRRRGEARGIRSALDQDHRGALRPQQDEARQVLCRWRGEAPGETAFFEEAHVDVLPLGGVVAVTDQHGESAFRSSALDAAGDVRDEEVPGVEHDEADRRAASGAQSSRLVVQKEPDFRDGAPDPVRPRGVRLIGGSQQRRGSRIP